MTLIESRPGIVTQQPELPELDVAPFMSDAKSSDMPMPTQPGIIPPKTAKELQDALRQEAREVRLRQITKKLLEQVEQGQDLTWL